MRRKLSQLLRSRWRRIAITFLPLLFALLHVSGVLHLHALERLDHLIYDTRLRATMPRTMDPRIVIVDIDEKSLAQLGHWPWSRDKLAALADELFGRQQVAAVGFDVVFAEADGSSGLSALQRLAQHELKAQPGFARALQEIAPSLDYDAQFARSLEGQSAVLGYYFTSDKDGRRSGKLPVPVLRADDLRGPALQATSWNGFGSNIEHLAQAVVTAGFFNSVTDSDGLVRFLPLLAEHDGDYYESLALALYRTVAGLPAVVPGYAFASPPSGRDPLQSIVLRQGTRSLPIPVDDRLAVLVPFRGPGDASGGSFRYLSASDVVQGHVPAASLRDQIVLVGSTAPGLMDLRATPVGRAYPGVEVHANVLSALLEGKSLVRPDYAAGYDVLQLVLAGMILAFALPLLPAGPAVVLSACVIAALAGVNLWLYSIHGLALPLATAVVMSFLAFALNMAYGYFVESRSKRKLATLFGTYVPPELVNEMVKAPEKYTMEAANRELTVMFCDMRGFTAMSERMDPVQLQQLLNDVFSQLTHIIRSHRGTIDKYMGDCVMAFWGAPIAAPDHAHLAVSAAVDMAEAIEGINRNHRLRGLPDIGVGIGLNTGLMCVGDMGSDIRRSYTVIGDAVNLGSRLEGLSKTYGTAIVVSEATREQAKRFAWMELDRVQVKGKDQAVVIYSPVTRLDGISGSQQEMLRTWGAFLDAYRLQRWDDCDTRLIDLRHQLENPVLLQEYQNRVTCLRMQVLPLDWDAATRFDTK